ncbi:MAG: hypothetical protein Q7R40_14875 [Phaeospirillum sp.]|nr:hypothetical protein [Phaeospirillum sp.]
MDANIFMLVLVAVAFVGFIILTTAYFAAFRVFGYRPLRPGVGRVALIQLLSWVVVMAVFAVAFPLGVADLPDPFGPMLMVVIFHGAQAALTYLILTRPDRRPALLLPLFPTMLFAIVVAASVVH